MYYNSDFDIRDFQLSQERQNMFNTITLGFSAKDEIKQEKLLEQELMDFTDAMEGRREEEGGRRGVGVLRVKKERKNWVYFTLHFFSHWSGKINSVPVGGRERPSLLR